MARVLIVEKNAPIRIANVRLVTSFSHTPMSAVDGEEAFSFINNQKPFDLIICGFDLPDMSGFELLQKLRKNPQTLSTPIIMYADIERHIGEACEKLGAKYVRSPGKLDEAIIEILGH